MEPGRLADVRAGTADSSRSNGSGYLLAPRLVLTARHVVTDPEGRPWPRIEVRVGHPRNDVPVRVGAQVCWPESDHLLNHRLGHPRPADAALLHLAAPVGHVEGVLWGEPQGTRALEYQGIGFPLFADYEDAKRGVEQLRGMLPPLATGPGGALVLDQSAAPRSGPRRERPWAGVSGAAVFCSGCLVGIVVRDDAEFDNRRLHALPAHALIADRSFAAIVHSHTGVDPEVMAVHAREGVHDGQAEHLTAPDTASGAEIGVSTGPLAAYLEAAAQAAETAPYSTVMAHLLIHRGLPRLPQVHVQARAWARDSEVGTDVNLFHEDRADAIPLDERAYADEVFALPEDVLLVGAPGSGKSTLLRWGVHALITRLLAGAPATWVPVLLHASDLDSPAPWREVIARGVRLRLGRAAEDSLTASFFDRPPTPDCRLLLLVDGLDEVVETETRLAVLATLARWRDEDPQSSQYRFIVTTRPLIKQEVVRARRKFRQFDLLPFDEEQVSALACRWFDAVEEGFPQEATSRFLAWLGRDERNDLASNPLVATMLCLLFIADAQRALPSGRHAVYHEFVELLRKQHYPGPRHEPRGIAQIAAVRETYGEKAGQAAEELLATSFGLVSRVALARYNGDARPAVDLVTDWTADQQPTTLDDTPGAWPSIVRETLRATGLLVQRGDDFDFPHQTIADYLAARGIASDPDARNSALRTVLSRNRLRLWIWTGGPPVTSVIRFLIPECLIRPDGDEDLRNALAKGASFYAGAWLVAKLTADGTQLDRHTVDTAAATLYRQATRARSEQSRLNAARTLADMHHACAAEALASIATVRGRKIWTRISAARLLTRLDDDRGAGVLLELSGDPSIIPEDRIWAAQTLMDAGLPRAGEALFALATDSELAQHHQVTAARLLGESGDPAGADILFSIATNPGTSGFMATNAAHDLDQLGDLRGREALLELADDATRPGEIRVLAARILASLNDPRGPAALWRLATSDALDEKDRMRAADHLSPEGPGYARGVEISYFGLRESQLRGHRLRQRFDPEPGVQEPDLESFEAEKTEKGPPATWFATRRSKVMAALSLMILLCGPVIPALGASAFTAVRTGDSTPWATTVFGLFDLALVAVSVFWVLLLGVVTAAVPEGPDGAYEEGPEVLYFDGVFLCVPVLIAALVVGLVEPTWLGPVGSAGTWLGRSLSWGEQAAWLLALGLLAALSLVATAINVRKRLARPMPSTEGDYARIFLRGDVLVSRDRLAEGEHEYRRLIAHSIRVHGPHHPATIQGRYRLADLHHRSGALTEAESEYRSVLELQRETCSEDSPDLLETRSRLGDVLHAQGRLEEAEAEHRAVFDARELLLGPRHAATLEERDKLVQVLDVQGKLEEIRQLLQAAEGEDDPW